MSESLDSDEMQQLHTAIRLSQTTISVSHKDLSNPYPLYPFKYTYISCGKAAKFLRRGHIRKIPSGWTGHLWNCRSHYHITKIEGSEIPLRRSRSNQPEQVWVDNYFSLIFDHFITSLIHSFLLLFLLFFFSFCSSPTRAPWIME